MMLAKQRLTFKGKAVQTSQINCKNVFDGKSLIQTILIRLSIIVFVLIEPFER